MLMAIAILCCSIPAMAAYDGGFNITGHTEEGLSTLLKNLDADILTKEPQNQKINSFSVSNSGSFAIVIEDYVFRTICVYNPEGVFQYGYRIETEGEVGTEFCGEQLFIYHSRSGIVYSLDENARVREIWNVEPTRENYSYAHYNENGIFSERKIINGKTYALSNNSFLDRFASSFTKLIVTDSFGNQKILYDAGSTVPSMIFDAIGILIPVAGTIFGLLVLFERRRKIH